MMALEINSAMPGWLCGATDAGLMQMRLVKVVVFAI